MDTFGSDIWIAHGAHVAVAGFHYGTRMTIIRMPDGGSWLHSPVAMSTGLRTAVDALGPVRHLVAPNHLHHLALGDWAEAYPDARVHAPPGLRRKRADLTFHADLTDTPDPAWAGVIDQVIVPGNLITKEVVFFHRPSATVIFTDLLQQFPPGWFKGWRGAIARMDGMVGSAPNVPKKFRMATTGRAAARKAIGQVLDWPAEKLIIAHGDPVPSDAGTALRNAFGWLMR